jgi:hypothetical protein
VRSKICSVITISAPHAGTCLALSAPARLFRQPLRHLGGTPTLAIALWHLTASLQVDEMALGAMFGALTDAGSAAAYVIDVLRARTLVDDLQPHRMMKLRETFRVALPDVQVRTVVTLAGKHSNHYVDATGREDIRMPDAFFADLYEHTAGVDGRDATYDDWPWLQKAVARLERALAHTDVIRNAETELRPLSPMLNDGIVNTARQLIDPDDPDELLAVVVGDHIDVLGYYPRYVMQPADPFDALRPKLRSGILHSGSGFGDDQFFDLFRRVAEVVVRSEQQHSTPNGHAQGAALV